MNYDEMTDFEINKAVASISINGASEFWQDVPSKQAVSVFNKAGISLAIVDYCNSWADAGPIIEENKIDLNACTESLGDGEWVYNGYWSAYGVVNGKNGYLHSSDVIHVSDESQLRAAMICFLMMKEQENG